ncbi:MAG: hypothetical protein JW864_07910 [Spirochaetes bacterium]|nr:hypothetical protein [Spirochaetota bacterium]
MNEIDKLNKAVDSLSEQKKKLEIALHYTHGDADKAKKMISGAYKDVYAIKARFSASNTFGAFLMFFNIPYSSLIHSCVVLSRSYILEDIKTSLQWRVFEEEVEKFNQEGNYDSEMTSKMRDNLADAFVIKLTGDQRANELKKNLELNDEIAANRVIKKFIQDRFGFQNIDLSVDYEQISSLDMELFSITSNKIELKKQSEENKKGAEEPEIEPFKDEEDELSDKDVQHIIQGALILAPIKGKSISSVQIGDRLKVNFTTSSSTAVSIAKALNAYEDGNFKPISARVVSIRHLADGGYKIFCLIAKGIYVRIEEEEDNIKVAIDGLVNGSEKEAVSFRMPVIFILAVIFIILTGTIILLLVL